MIHLKVFVVLFCFEKIKYLNDEWNINFNAFLFGQVQLQSLDRGTHMLLSANVRSLPECTLCIEYRTFYIEV